MTNGCCGGDIKGDSMNVRELVASIMTHATSAGYDSSVMAKDADGQIWAIKGISYDREGDTVWAQIEGY